MKLTNRGRYAVMAMADLALNAKNGPISLTEISLRQNISLAYLEQIFLKLKKNNLVKSSRGANGGYVLEKYYTLVEPLYYSLFHRTEDEDEERLQQENQILDFYSIVPQVFQLVQE